VLRTGKGNMKSTRAEFTHVYKKKRRGPKSKAGGVQIDMDTRCGLIKCSSKIQRDKVPIDVKDCLILYKQK